MRLDKALLCFLNYKIVFTLENPKKTKLFRISYSCQMIFSVLYY